MKQLVLKELLRSKLARLPKGVSTLWFEGIDPNVLTRKPCIAVVGTRKPTPYGKDLTERVVADLVRAGVVIVSGLAFGVDITAHTTTLSEGGETIAVLPSDTDHIYPSSHRAIAAEIQRSGSLVSEHLRNPTPRKEQFLERNRIIAALSDAVFIPEAATRSGSLNTAAHAENMGIPVFAAPGRVTDHMSAGTNERIAAGKATLATSATDILSALNITSPIATQRTAGTDEQNKVLRAVESGTHDTTSLQKELATDTATLQTTLTLLEIQGLITQDALGRWQLRT